MHLIKTFSLSLLSAFACSSLAANADEWFIEKTSITNAHKALLEGQLEKSFDSIVQTWQKEPSDKIKQHLNQLLNKALESDCGKTFDTSGFPKWLDKVTIERQTIQNMTRVNYKLKLDIESTEQLAQVQFTKWPDLDLINQSLQLQQPQAEELATQPVIWPYTHSIDMNAQIDTGLYKIKIQTQDQQEWESWIVLSKRHSKRVVRWSSNDSWVVDKKELLNEFCPLPILTVSLSGNSDKSYKKVWEKSYESKFPESVPDLKLPPDRYLLNVSITHKRWQGLILVQDKQIMNKAYDITN